jgi:hypothetical protein
MKSMVFGTLVALAIGCVGPAHAAECGSPWAENVATAAERGFTPIELTGDDLRRFVVNYNTSPPASNFAPDRVFVVDEHDSFYIFLNVNDCTENIAHVSRETFEELIGPIVGDV